MRKIGRVKVLDEENNFIMWTPQYQVKDKKVKSYGGRYISKVEFGNKKIQKRLRQLKKETRYYKMKRAKCHKDKYGYFPAPSIFIGQGFYKTNGEWKTLGYIESVELKTERVKIEKETESFNPYEFPEAKITINF